VSETWEVRNENLKTLELAAFSTFRTSFNWKVSGKTKLRKALPANSFSLSIGVGASQSPLSPETEEESP
jgi:hypothetical protein